ncbi:MAG: type II secretion system GspH family protein [Proteobacteria bacterium]|nr:type II secretion system GspH family protein [Pseudomonadota bacterium]MBU1585654.1 type II secretion system GspH family protein [Pseudomonadota bacterium]MBU2431876.1 type II secretion system GspH family protein [Pseudomonadota bacterium]MBU2630720.1 type II secretion system GspH family protein [Pseudomonadota bacterium]
MVQRLPYKINFKKGSDTGFTLIEMAMVMVIVGIVISIMMTVLPSVIKTGKLKEARANLEKYDNALKGYAIINLRLPFADSNGDGFEDAGFDGDLPYRTLGLSNGNDVWGYRVKYAVYGSLTGTPIDKAALLVILGALPSPPTGANFNSTIVYTTDSDTCAGANGNNSSNQAYVIASGGPKDLDGNNSPFDLCTGTAGAGFNADNKIQALNYDDIVRALSITEFGNITCGP